MKHIEFPETGFLRLPEVLKLFPVSKSSWYLGVKTGKYPKPVKLSENISAWLWSTPNIESSFRLVLFGFRSGVKGYVWGA